MAFTLDCCSQASNLSYSAFVLHLFIQVHTLRYLYSNSCLPTLSSTPLFAHRLFISKIPMCMFRSPMYKKTCCSCRVYVVLLGFLLCVTEQLILVVHHQKLCKAWHNVVGVFHLLLSEIRLHAVSRIYVLLTIYRNFF